MEREKTDYVQRLEAYVKLHIMYGHYAPFIVTCKSERRRNMDIQEACQRNNWNLRYENIYYDSAEDLIDRLYDVIDKASEEKHYIWVLNNFDRLDVDVKEKVLEMIWIKQGDLYGKVCIIISVDSYENLGVRTPLIEKMARLYYGRRLKLFGGD